MSNRMYNIKEASKLLGLSINWLYELRRIGKLDMETVGGKLCITEEGIERSFGHSVEEIQRHTLFAKEVAYITGYSYAWVRKLAAKGDIPHIRIADSNRFDPNTIPKKRR